MNNNLIESRRRFIFGSALTLTGVITGFIGSNKALSELIYLDDDKITSLAPSIWVEITKDGIIIITVSRSEIGQGVRTSLPMILAEELDADWEQVKIIQAEADSKYGSQATGGSTSIRQLWQPLRVAGAQARKMLITSASLIWGIPEDDCYTDKSYVYEKNGSRKLAYKELIDKAITLPVPPANSVQLKNRAEYKIIGQTRENLDELDIVKGTAKFGSDFRIEGMKYATILRSPYVRGTLISYDDIETKKIKGVINTYRISEGIAVVADNSWSALEGRDALKANWNPGPLANVSSDDIRQAFLNKIGTLPNLPSNTSKSIEAIYEVPFLAHTTMEPMSAVAHFVDNKCEVWAGTQNPMGAKSAVASALGISQDNIKINVLISGGGFGRRLDSDYIAIAAKISKSAGVPILFFYTKEDDIKNDPYRATSIHAVKAGIDANGNPTGWIHKVISQGSVNAMNPEYNIPNINNLSDISDFGIRVGPWRSVDYTQVIYVNECLMDELAHLAGKDPFIFRYELARHNRLKNVLQIVSERSNWNTPLPQGQGKGIAAFVGYGAFIAHVIEVSISKEGKLKINKIYAVVDPGLAINPGNIKNQIMGAAIDALSTAINTEITLQNGQIRQSGFHNFRWLTMDEVPEFDIHIIETTDSPSGMGEVGFPSVTPALCNAIFNATGIRIRRLPTSKTSLVGVEEKKTRMNEFVDFQAYPMPFDSSFKLSIELKRWSRNYLDIKISDILGKIIAQSQLESNGTKFIGRFYLPALPSGTYYIIFSDNIESYSIPIIKN